MCKIKIVLIIIAIIFLLVFLCCPMLVMFLLGYAKIMLFSPKAPVIYSNNCVNHCLITYEKDYWWIDYPDYNNHDEMINNIVNQRKNIYYLNLHDKNSTKKVINSEPSDIQLFAKYENKIIWTELQSDKDKSIIYLKDISIAEEEKQILTVSNIVDVELYEDSIIIAEKKFKNKYEKPNVDIYKYDITNKKKSLITDSEKNRSCISLHEEKLIYFESTNSLYGLNLYLYNLKTGENKKILTIKDESKYNSDYACPSIYNNIIAYMENDKLYKYNILSGDIKELMKIDPAFENEIGFIEYFNLHDNELKYLQEVTDWVGADIDKTFYRCTTIDINTKEKKNITCNGDVNNRD